MIRILLVDDKASIREEMRRLLELEEDIQVIGEAADGWEAIKRTRTLQPDLILMDKAMPSLDGIEATRLIKKDHPRARIIFLAAEDTGHQEALQAGAEAYLLKDHGFDAVVRIIKKAMEPYPEERIERGFRLWGRLIEGFRRLWAQSRALTMGLLILLLLALSDVALLILPLSALKLIASVLINYWLAAISLLFGISLFAYALKHYASRERVERGFRRLWAHSPALTVGLLTLLLVALSDVALLILPLSALELMARVLINHSLAAISLFFGVLFFAYALKYYTNIALILLFNGENGLLNGNGHVEGQRLRNGLRNGLRKIFGNGVDNAFANGYHLKPETQPFVSIHLPLYNEKKVVDRLLTASTSLDYENYEVIVADDSTDETTKILERWADHPRVKISHRQDRSGFKGGALQVALQRTDPRAEFITVFDADFIPPPDIITQFLAYFYNGNGDSQRYADDRVAVVQGYQWHILNASENWITRCNRVEFSGSYVIERPGQQLLGSMKMIAGSVFMIRADVLRKHGWGISITEDWELTLRLYLDGYKVLYTPFIQAPAECISRFLTLAKQRMRWARGHTFNVKRYFWRVLTSPKISRQEKAEFLYYAPYYLQSIFFIIGTACWFISELILHQSVPYWTALLGWSLLFTNTFALVMANLSGLFLERGVRHNWSGIFSFLVLSNLLVPFQAYAALRGLLDNDEGGWHRTPKSGLITEILGRLRLGKKLKRLLPKGRKRPGSIDIEKRLGLATSLPGESDEGGESQSLTPQDEREGETASSGRRIPPFVPPTLIPLPRRGQELFNRVYSAVERFWRLLTGDTKGQRGRSRRSKGRRRLKRLSPASAIIIVILAAMVGLTVMTFKVQAAADNSSTFWFYDDTTPLQYMMYQSQPSGADTSSGFDTNFYSDTFSSSQSIEAGSALVYIYATNNETSALTINFTLNSYMATTQLGSGSLTVPANTTTPTLFSTSFATSAYDFCGNERLRLNVDQPAGPYTDTDVYWDGQYNDSRLATPSNTYWLYDDTTPLQYMMYTSQPSGADTSSGFDINFYSDTLGGQSLASGTTTVYIYATNNETSALTINFTLSTYMPTTQLGSGSLTVPANTTTPTLLSTSFATSAYDFCGNERLRLNVDQPAGPYTDTDVYWDGQYNDSCLETATVVPEKIIALLLFVPFIPLLMALLSRKRRLVLSLITLASLIISNLAFLSTKVPLVHAAPDVYYLHDTNTTGINPAGEYMNTTVGTGGTTLAFDTATQDAFWYTDITYPEGLEDGGIAAGPYALNMYFDQLPPPANAEDWGKITVGAYSTGLNHSRAMGGTSPNEDDMVIKSISMYLGAQTGNVRLAIYTGGQLDDPTNATLLWDAGTVNPGGVAGWYTIQHPTGVSWPKNTVTWLAWKRNTGVLVYASNQSAEAGDFQTARGRNENSFNQDPAVAFPSTYGEVGTFTNYWYSIYATYEVRPEVQITASVYHTKDDGTDPQEIVTSSTVTIDSNTPDPYALNIGSGAEQTFTAADPRRLRARINVTSVKAGGSFTLAYDSGTDPTNLDTPVVTVPENVVGLVAAVLIPALAGGLWRRRRRRPEPKGLREKEA